VLGTLEGVDRPALAAVVPNREGRTVVVDVGANAQCKARHLEDFAIMGSAYARGVLGVARPRVGLMSVGEEETKGNDLVREAHEVLKRSSLNFVGNVEGHDFFTGKVDVVVLDGFTGNVVLKATETAAELVFEMIRGAMPRGVRGALLGLLLRPALVAVRRRSDPDEIGGAPLLGLRGSCVIGHGKSGARAIEAGIRTAASFHTSGVNAAIERELCTLGRAADGAPSPEAASA
jgi:glycerol-3-phosphate acyltransferase PlsX